MPDTKPQYGLPFKQLPITSPESALNEQIQIGRKQIGDKYRLMWDEINRSAQFIGRQKAFNMRRQIISKRNQEILQFDQQAKQQLAQLRNIDRLAQQGAIPNPDEIKTRMVFGTDVAKSMYPKPEKEKPPMQQFGELDVYSHRISDELKWFKEDKPPKPSKALFALGPLVGIAGAYRKLAAAKKRKVWVWDPATEDYTIKATPEKIAEYDMWLQEKRDVAERKKELLGQLDVSRRIVQPGTKGGTFSDKIAESVRPQRQIKRQPTVTELRQRGTREAYEQGKALGYWL